MKAQELLSQYAKGDRDFQGARLRGENFAGQQLSGIDLSGADIHGTNFREATLQGANFSRTEGGVQNRWLTLQIIVGFCLALFVGFFQGFTCTFPSDFFDGRAAGILAGCIMQAFFLALLATIGWLGLNSRALGIALLSGLGGVIIAIAIEQIAPPVTVGDVSASGQLAAALPVTLISLFITTTAFVGIVPFLQRTVGICLSGLLGAVAFYSAVDMLRMEALSQPLVFLGALNVACVLGLNSYVACRALQSDPRFAIARQFGVALSTIGGTCFEGTDLTQASFREARLQNVRFQPSKLRPTNLQHTCWQDAKHLDGARVSGTILTDRRVRSLLTTPEKGYQADLSYANLRGANLNGVTLEEANLSGAILKEALVTNAMLKNAVLSNVQAAGANFSMSCMTGAVLDQWKIDVSTQFDRVDCQYFFLAKRQDLAAKQDQDGGRDRRPKDNHKVFGPGEFAHHIHQLFDGSAPIRSDQLHKGQKQPAIIAQTPAITQKPAPANQPVPSTAVSEPTHAHAEKSRQRQSEREAELIKNAQDMKELAFLIAKQPINIHNENRNHIVTNDQSQNIHVGGNFSIAANNSVVNLGEIGGELKNQIAQIGQSDPQEQLRVLLSELQVAIEEEPLLSEEEKAEALEEVKELAIAGQDPDNSKFKKMAKRALNTLKGMALGMTTTAALLPAYNKLLPEIATLMGL